MKKKRKLPYIFIYITIFILIFVSITLVIATIRQKVNSLEFQLMYVLEKELHARVDIGKVEGDFVKNVVLKDVKIYHEFRKDKRLVDAAEVRIDFNLKKALVKEKFPVRYIDKITVKDFDLYMDEYFGQLKAVKVLSGRDDGEEGGAKNLIVDLKGGRVHSIFLKKNLGKFNATVNHTIFKKTPYGLYIDGSGVVQGNEVYGNTKTRFRMRGDDSLKHGYLKGTLDIENISYLGYQFHGISFDYVINSEKIKFNLTPTKYKPYLKTIPEHVRESYSSNNPYNYLLNLSFEMLLDEEEIYISVPVNSSSDAVETISRNFLKSIDMTKYIRKDFDYNVRGNIFFKFNRGQMNDFYVNVNNANGVLTPGDNLAFQFSKSGSSPVIQGNMYLQNLIYITPQDGSIQGSAVIAPNQDIKSIDLVVHNIHIPNFFPDIPKKSWKLGYDSSNKPIDVKKPKSPAILYEKIDLNRDYISSHIKLQNSDNKYKISLTNNKLKSKALPDIKGDVHIKDRQIHAEITDDKKSLYNLVTDIDFSDKNKINLELKLKHLNYSVLKNILELEENWEGTYFKAIANAQINLKNFEKSLADGKINIYTPPKSNKKYFLPGYEYMGYDYINVFYDKFASINLSYKKGNLYFNDSAFYKNDLSFNGLINFQNGYIKPEFTIKYKDIPIYVDGSFSEINGKYLTKINVIYDNFKHQLTSFQGYLKFKENNIYFHEATLRHLKKSYDIQGSLGLYKNKISPNIKITSHKVFQKDLIFNTPQTLHILGDISYIKGSQNSQLLSDLTLKINKNPINLKGLVLMTDEEIIPQLKLSWSFSDSLKKELDINGFIYRKAKGLQGEFRFTYDKENIDLYANVLPIRNGINLSLQILAMNNDIKIDGNILSLKDKKIQTKLNINFNEDLISFDSILMSKNGIFYTSSKLKKDDKIAYFNGYLANVDNFYFPYLKIDYYQPGNKGKTFHQPILIEGRVTEFNNFFDIDTTINKKISLKGKYEKYSLLLLKLFINDLDIITPEKNKLIVYNKYNEDGITIKLSPEGLITRGDIGAKGFSFLPSDKYEIETNFDYHIPFNQDFLKKLKQVSFNSVVVKNNNKIILTSHGGLSINKNVWNLVLADQQNKTNLNIQYDPKNQFINSSLQFKDFNLKSLDPNMQGSLTGTIEMKGSTNNPNITANNVVIKNGKYLNMVFDTTISFKKTDRDIFIENAFITLGNSALQVNNLKYKFPKKLNSLSQYFTQFFPKSIITIENILFYYKKTKVHLQNVKYSVGKNRVLFLQDTKNIHTKKVSNNKEIYNVKIDKPDKELSFDYLKILSNPDSHISFEKGSLTWKDSMIDINKFSLKTGKYWKLDLDLKLKIFLFGNRYLSNISIFGGRTPKKGEMNLIATRLLFNDNSFRDIEIIFEAIGEKWILWKNRLNLDGFIIWTKEILKYQFNYNGNSTKLNHTGKVLFDSQNIDFRFKIYNDDISISTIAPIVFQKAGGKIKSDLHLHGNWNDPKIEGLFNLTGGFFQLTGQDDTFDNINININFNPKKSYHFNNIRYFHQFMIQGNYNEGDIITNGYFNFNRWNISDFDIKLIMPKSSKIYLKNQLFEYDGYVKSNLRFFGNQRNKTLDGKIYLSDAKINYLGKKTFKKVEKSFFTTILLDTVEIIFLDKVRSNIGQGQLSLGEVIIKENSSLKIKRKKADLDTDNYQISGVIEAKKGDFDYLGHSFDIIEAKIVFDKNQEPKILVKASTKVRDENNRLVNIFFTINQSLISLFQEQKSTKESVLISSLSSSPPKSPQEITLLLGTKPEQSSERESSLRQSQSQAAIGRTADVALNLTLIKPIERKLKELFGIDTFNIKQKFLQNTLFRESTSSDSTANTEGSEINLLRNTEITIGYYLHKNIYISGGLVILQNTNPGNNTNTSQTQKVWKFGLEVDILPLIGVQSERVKLRFVPEYQYKPDEINPTNRNEGIFKIEINIEF